MIADSKGPTPRSALDPPFNFRLDNDPATLAYPAILLFAERPTLKHAKMMLRAYNINPPLSTLLPGKPYKKTRANKPKSEDLKGGAKASIISELLILDTMHDLLHHDPKLVYNIFKKEIDLPLHLKTSFLASQYSFSRDAANYILKRAEINLTSTSYYPVPPEIKKMQKYYDGKLVNAISTWTNMKFVLDNFVAGLDPNGTKSKGTFALIGCAYLIVLIANMKRLNLLVGNKIVFLDGFFMHIDGNYMQKFTSLFTKTIARLTNMHTIIKPYIDDVNISIPKYYNQLFNTNVSINKTHVTFKNIKYDIFDYIQTNKSTISFPHSKEDFYEHFKNNPKNKDLWYLNFLRDAFKADVAVETNSIYMTHDRLAHTYYKLIGGKHGFLLSLEDTGDDLVSHCEYSVSF